MSYRVNYYTLAIMPDGRRGNVKQGSDHIFTDNAIPDIQDALNLMLAPRSRVGVIEKIEDVGGGCSFGYTINSCSRNKQPINQPTTTL